MVQSLAIINCGQVVTLAGPKRPRVGVELQELSVMKKSGVLVRDGIIIKVGPSDEIESLLDANAMIVDAGGRILMPGFVDAHAHPVFAGTRVAEFEERANG